jgi:hypothetical protein
MANSINVNQNNNNVSLQDANGKVTITDDKLGVNIEVTQPVTNIVTVSTIGPQGQPGEIPSTGSFVLTSSFNAFTASYYIDSASFDTNISNNSSSITLLSGSFETFSGSYNTGSFTGSFYGDGSNLTGIVSSKWTGSNPITREGNVEITGSLIISGSSTFINIGPAIFSGSVTGINGFTGSLLGTAESASYVLNAESASYALTASYAANVPLTASYALNAESASYALTASYIEIAQTASYVENAQTASFVILAQTASYIETAQTASYYNETDPVFTAVSGTFVLTSSFDQFTSSYNTGSFTGSFTGDGSQLTGIVSSKWTGSNPISRDGNVEITGSLNVTNGITASLYGTASWAENSITASYVENAQTASYVLNAISSSFATTASFITASGVYGPYGSNSVITSSYSLTALSASHAITSSYAILSSYAATASYSQNIQISGSVNNVDYIDFNTSSAIPAWKSGRVFWDNTDGALSVYNAEQDITLQVGQENWTRVSNRTGTTITNGTVVRLLGAHGDLPEVERAQSLLVSGSINVLNQILGVATHDIEHNSKGFITTQGLVRGLNTNAFNDGDTLFVGTGSSGALTNIPPYAPYEIIPVGVCVKAGPGGSGIIYVTVQEPIDFSDLSSVLVEGIYHYGDLWTYVQSGSTGVWIHTNQLSGSYGLTGSLTVTSGVTASLLGTASFATSASNAVTASYIITAQTASYVLNAVSSSFASTASFVQTAQTASYVQTAQTASYVLNAVSASFATSASNSISSSFALTASQAATASYVLNAITASHALEANTVLPLGGNNLSGFISYVISTGSMQYVRAHHTLNIDIPIGGATSTVNLTGSLVATSITSSLQGTASFANTSTSASYALTASYALNGGGGGGTTFPYTGSAIISGSLAVTGSIYTDSTIYSPLQLALNFIISTNLFI